MPVHRRVLSKDEELGKREDAFRPRRSVTMPKTLTQPWRWRKRRVVLVLLGLLLLYFFIQNIPADLIAAEERLGMTLRPGRVLHGAQELKEPSGAPSYNLDTDEEKREFWYNGPIKFYKLATSLHAITRTMGARSSNRNVLFAASSLRSVANLMPMACEMGKWERNYVHLAILGRDTLPLEDILEVNGVHANSCTVYFHDARSDYAEFSSDQRAEVAVSGAMKHINDFMHPQAIIMDDSSLEDGFFTRAMRKKTKDLRRALIEVPEDRYEDFLWMTRLDSGSLGSWHKPSIDILVHAPHDGSGGLIRLVKSLEKADYAGLRAPRLTVELPPNTEYFVKRYLEDLDWPPDVKTSPLRTSALSLRHRISLSHTNSEQASLRFLESFYPTNTEDNHVLVLSPQAEVDASFLQYLYYVILEYRYSSYVAPESDGLLGISLHVPSSFINGTHGFRQPAMADIDVDDDSLKKEDPESHSPFLYQGPSAIATLIFGEQWAVFHNFLSNRLAASQTGKVEKLKKQVSETEPAWVEYLLELMRARGWNILHPATPFVTVHNELAQIPEEYLRKTKDGNEDPEPASYTLNDKDEPFLTAPEPPAFTPHVEQNQDAGAAPLQDMLPFNGDLPELPHLPHLSGAGQLIKTDTFIKQRDEYAIHFRRHIGGCDEADAKRRPLVRDMGTGDLFCLPGIEHEYEEESEDEEDSGVAEAIAKSTEPSADIAEDVKTEEPQIATVETKEEVAAQGEITHL